MGGGRKAILFFNGEAWTELLNSRWLRRFGDTVFNMRDANGKPGVFRSRLGRRILEIA